jgi:hypothetical protein
LALAGALTGLLAATAASAQTGAGQPPSVEQTAYEYSNYYAQDDAKPPVPDNGGGAPDAAAGTAACATCNNACCDDGCALFAPGSFLNPTCCLGTQWKLCDDPCLKENNITIAGWLAQSYTWNTANPADRFNGPVTWTDRSRDYELNQLYLYGEKATNTNGCGTDLGWRADVMFGTDYRFNTESGLETRGQFTSPILFSSQRFYGVAFTQFYGEVAVNDLKVKVGHWYAPVGYEVVPTTGNFFPSLPYTFQYGEPFTMTGAIGTYTVNPNVSVGGGVMRGWDNFDNSNPHMSFVGTYTEKFSDGASLAIANTAGDELNQASNFTFRYLQTNVYSRPLKRISENLNYVAQSDFGYQNNALLSGHAARWYGLNQYLFYKMSDCLTYGIRYEWFRDEEGFRVGGFLGTTPDGSLRGLSTSRAGYIGNFFEVTAGANYKFSANTTIRPYVRFDWFSGVSTNPTGVAGNPERPYDNGFGNSQTLLGFDVVTIY